MSENEESYWKHFHYLLKADGGAYVSSAGVKMSSRAHQETMKSYTLQDRNACVCIDVCMDVSFMQM